MSKKVRFSYLPQQNAKKWTFGCGRELNRTFLLACPAAPRMVAYAE